MSKGLKISSLYSLEHTIAKDIFEGKDYPWEVLPLIGQYIIELGKTLDKEEYNQVADNVWIHKTAKVFESAYINGPTIMMGYINEDEETAKTLVNHSDGKIWLHTGDLGYRNEDGLLFYSSRLKRMIITNGYNVYPIELEEIISKCECVSSCTVVGIPHKTKGQTPKAVIVLKDGYEDTLETKAKVRAYCKEHLAAYAVPSEIEYRKSVPVTAIGKVAYRELEKKHKKK